MVADMNTAFWNGGQIARIACINQATVPIGVDFTKLIATLQRFLNFYFSPVWNTPAILSIATAPIAGQWTMVFLDDADVAGALGYHDLTVGGLPLSKIFVKTTIQDGQKVAVTACHELAEMLIDPAINMGAQSRDGTFYAYETCDACEEEIFTMDGIPMSDFVYPSYFEDFREAGSTTFDFMKRIHSPLQILPGGYMSVFANGQWSQRFGSQAKAERFAKEHRAMHRSEYRRNLQKWL